MLKLLLWKALSHQSFLMCFWMKTSVWIWTSFWNGFGKQLFPPYNCCWARALPVGVSTATCEASFSSVVRILTPYSRCMTHELAGRNEVGQRPGQEASLAPSCSNLRPLWSKCTVLKKIFVALFGLFGAPAVIRAPVVIQRPGNCAPPLVTPLRPYKCQRVLLGFEKKGNSFCGKWRYRFRIFVQNLTTACLKYSLATASASVYIIHLLCYVAGVGTAAFVTVYAQIYFLVFLMFSFFVVPKLQTTLQKLRVLMKGRTSTC